MRFEGSDPGKDARVFPSKKGGLSKESRSFKEKKKNASFRKGNRKCSPCFQSVEERFYNREGKEAGEIGGG